MRTWNSVFQLGFQTLTNWYHTTRNIFSDAAPFFIEVEKEEDYQQFQQWCSDLKQTLRVDRKAIENGGVDVRLFRENLLAHQASLQENIVSPFYYQQQLTALEEKLKQQTNLVIPTVFFDVLHKAKARLREQLEVQSDLAESYFYNDLINHVIDSTGKQNTEETLRALLTYYKNLVEENVYQSIEETMEDFIESRNVYYQEEENSLNPLPDVLMRQVLRDINVNFLEARAKKNNQEEKQKDPFATRFLDAILDVVQESAFALQSGLKVTTKPKALVTIGTAAAVTIGTTADYQTTHFINSFVVACGINMVGGDRFAAPISIIVELSSLLQPIVGTPTQTIENEILNSNWSDRPNDNTALALVKRQNSASLPIVSMPYYVDLVGTYDTSGQSWDLFVASGDLVYIADGPSGLLILNASVPRIPVLLGSYNTPGTAVDVAVSGSFAYVADAGFGLQVIDVSTPSAPIRVGGYDTPGSALEVTISDNLVYLTDDSAGVQIIDVSVPSAPAFVGNYNTPDRAFDAVVSGNFAYIADYSTGLLILNVSIPSSPTLVSNYNTPDLSHSLVLSGGLAYIADWVSGIQIIDVNIPSAPIWVGSLATPGSARGITVSDHLIYVGDYSLGLQVIDVSTPSVPRLVGSYDTLGIARGVEVSNNLVYVADDSAGLQIIAIDSVPKLLVNTLTIAQGQSRVIGSNNLLASDQDNDNNTLTYVVEALQRGLFRLRSSATALTEFTQQQVLNGEIEFVHDGGSFLPPSYTISVSDNVARTSPATASINFSLTPSTTGSISALSSSNTESDTAGLTVGLLLGGGGALMLSCLGGLLGAYYYKKRQLENTILERGSLGRDSEIQLVGRKDKGWTEIGAESGRVYALINKIPQKEANLLKTQTGITVTFISAQHKTDFTLGHGQFGKLRLAKIVEGEGKGDFVGVKKIKGTREIASSQREAELQKKVSAGPHIMPLWDSVKTEGSKGQPALYQFMPLAGAGNGEDLQRKLKSVKALDSTWLVLQVARQLLEGFAYLHEQGVFHLDFKLSNMVLDKDGQVYLIDFGCAQETQGGMLTESLGDLRYFSPERLALHRSISLKAKASEGRSRVASYLGSASDLWALGVILIELLLGEYPFDRCDASEKLKCWDADYFEEKLSAAFTAIETGGENRAEREAVVDLLKGLLVTIPGARSTTAKAALKHAVFDAVPSNPQQLSDVLEQLDAQSKLPAITKVKKEKSVPKFQDKNYAATSLYHYETDVTGNSVSNENANLEIRDVTSLFNKSNNSDSEDLSANDSGYSKAALKSS